MPGLLSFEEHRHMEPSFFIVGFQKCGTTTLYDSIMAHPDAEPGIIKENNILAEKAERIDEFRLCFPLKKSGKITGDASHLHTWMPYGLERIKKHFPKAKILVIMRNPVDRAFSHFNMDKKIGYIPESMTFERFIDVEMQLRSGLKAEASMEEVYANMKLFGNKYGWPISRGLYHVYIQRMIDLELDFLPIFTDNLQLDFDSEMNRVFEFIGLKPIEIKRKQSNRGVYEQDLDADLRQKLEVFYKAPNERLAQLLSKKLPW